MGDGAHAGALWGSSRVIRGTLGHFRTKSARIVNKKGEKKNKTARILNKRRKKKKRKKKIEDIRKENV